jgi:cytochrome b6-f complex iron-sulfur subunit
LAEQEGEAKQPEGEEEGGAGTADKAGPEKPAPAEASQEQAEAGGAGRDGDASKEAVPVGGPIVWQVAGGPALVTPSPASRLVIPRISRRTLMRIGFWTGAGVAVAGGAGVGLDLIYPRGIAGFGSEVSPGNVSDFPLGSKTHFLEGRFWLVNLTEEEGGPGILALWQKCPHLGCTVPWRADFVFTDPETHESKKGWFRCPCHGSTYTDAGVRVYGPAPRSMDTMKVDINEDGRIIVDTGAITKGSSDNPSRVVKV